MAALVMAACGQSQGTQASPKETPTIAPSAQPTAPLTGLKPVLAGLLDRAGPPPAAYVSVMGGFVVNVKWSDLQASPGADIAAGNPIDQAITTLHQIDRTGQMGLKIRLFAGIHAPDWVKSLGGFPIPITDPTTGSSGTVGRFWSAEFGAAYDDLMTKLAAKYDSAPEIREITISRCSTAYPEPFIRDTASAATVHALLAAGFTVAADQNCLREEILSHQVWVHTRSDLSFNPYQVIGGTSRTDEVFTEQMMAFCRSTLGARCMLANNSLRVPLQYPAMYDYMRSLGPPIAFQTAVMGKVGDLGAALDMAISLGAGSVELPAGFQSLPVPALSSYNNRLMALSTP